MQHSTPKAHESHEFPATNNWESIIPTEILPVITLVTLHIYQHCTYVTIYYLLQINYTTKKKHV